MAVREKIEYGSFIRRDGTIDRTIKLYFDTDKEMREYIEGLNGEYPEGFHASTITRFVAVESKYVPVSEMFAYQRSQEEEEE